MGRSMYFNKTELENLYHLVDESALNADAKEKLMNKLRGMFITPETQMRSEILLAKRDVRTRETIAAWGSNDQSE